MNENSNLTKCKMEEKCNCESVVKREEVDWIKGTHQNLLDELEAREKYTQ